MVKDVLLNAVEEAQLLAIFKNICDKYSLKRKKLRNIFAYSTNKEKTVYELIKKEENQELNEEETKRMLELILAFLVKSDYRANIDEEIKRKLLCSQNNKCAICGVDVSIKNHVDHIVPFKYVGDELDDNYQILCQSCNLKKNKSIEYQIKVLLKLV